MKIIDLVLLIVSRIAGCKKNELSITDKFIEDLNFCPTDLAIMYNLIEDKFNIRFSKEDELNICSIDDAIKSISKKKEYNEGFGHFNSLRGIANLGTKIFLTFILLNLY